MLSITIVIDIHYLCCWVTDSIVFFYLHVTGKKYTCWLSQQIEGKIVR